MYLNVKLNKRIYLAKVESKRDEYIFRFKGKDGNFDWRDYFDFKKFKCSLNCRLNHYKDFKKRVETKSAYKNSILLDKYIYEE